MPKTLLAAMEDEIYEIVRLNPSADHRRFTDAQQYLVNPAFFLHDVDLSGTVCSAPVPERGNATLVSNQIAISTSHASPADMDFLGTDGVLYHAFPDGTPGSTVDVGDDIRVIKLSTVMPAVCVPWKVAGPTFMTKLGSEPKVLFVRGHKKRTFSLEYIDHTTLEPALTAFVEDIILGDSGNAWFFVINRTPVMYGNTTSPLHLRFTEINTAMNTLTGQSLQEFDVSSYADPTEILMPTYVDNLWNGATSTVFRDASNWELNVIPDSTHNAILTGDGNGPPLNPSTVTTVGKVTIAQVVGTMAMTNLITTEADISGNGSSVVTLRQISGRTKWGANTVIKTTLASDTGAASGGGTAVSGGAMSLGG